MKPMLAFGLLLLLAACDSDDARQPAAASAPPAKFVLTVAKTGNGLVSSTPAGIACGPDCAESYGDGTAVTLSASPAAGWRFTGWSGACSTAGACRVTMNAKQTVGALFTEIPRYTLTVSAAGPGSVGSTPAGITCGTDCAEDFAEGSVVSLNPSAGSGARFAGWSGACSGRGECRVTMNAAATVGALFETIPSYPLTVNRSGSGSVSSDPAGINCPDACTANYREGAMVTLAAAAAAGFRFDGWMGACVNPSGTCSVTMNAARTVGARFTEVEQFLLTTTADNGGTVISDPAGISCGSDCEQSYEENSVVKLSVVEPSGFRFSNWTGACSGSGGCSVTMNADQTVGAQFTAVQQFVLSVLKTGAGAGTISSTPPDNGINCGSDCDETYNEGTAVTLNAQPTAGNSFGGWSGACTGSASCEVTMNAAKSVTGSFVPAAVTNAVDFATDTRTADGADPGSNLNPILSNARQHGDTTPVPGANADNKTWIDANVFVPAYSAGQTFPVVLNSHGWGGAKLPTPRGTGLPTVLANEGYIVVSFSQRGWGASEGEIRVMDPAYEGQDAKAVIDWLVAEAAAGRLPVRMDSPTDPRIGTVGGSYGGGFQFNLAAEDPRVDALAPDIAWHDLRYSLIPNGLIKASWANLLCAAGQTRPNRDEMLIKACDALPGASSSFRTKEGIETVVPGIHDFVHHNSMDFYETNGRSPVMGSPYAQKMPPVLLSQGMRDNLFNGLESYWNYQFLRGISPDVRLFTHQGGHILPLGQAAGGPQTCGPVNLVGNASAVTRKWFARYLKDDMTALDGVARVCISLENAKAIALDSVPFGNSAPFGGFTSGGVDERVTTDQAQPPTNSYFKRLTTITAAGQVLAGIPLLKGVTVKCPIPAPGVCPPVNPSTGVEPIALLGIGLKRGAAISLIDEQLIPVRTTGSPHASVPLPMVAEALNVDDEVGLLFYTVHGQYKVEAASSGGNSPPAAGPNDQYQFSASSVELPIFTPAAGSLLP